MRIGTASPRFARSHKGGVMSQLTIPVSAIWLRTLSNHTIEVLAEVNGEWRVVVTEHVADVGGAISHIAEALGSPNWPRDRL